MRFLKTTAALLMAAGLAGTALIQGMQAASQRWMPQTMPPMKENPGDFMVEQAEEALPDRISEKISEPVEGALSQGLAFGYGMTFGALYGLAGRRDRSLLLDGTLLGLGSWAVGYLGWLPATGLMPPVWKQEAKQVIPGILSHVAFGVATVAVLDWLMNRD